MTAVEADNAEEPRVSASEHRAGNQSAPQDGAQCAAATVDDRVAVGQLANEFSRHIHLLRASLLWREYSNDATVLARTFG